MTKRELLKNMRRARASFDFLLRHEKALRRLQPIEQKCGVYSPWLSHAIEQLDILRGRT